MLKANACEMRDAFPPECCSPNNMYHYIQPQWCRLARWTLDLEIGGSSSSEVKPGASLVVSLSSLESYERHTRTCIIMWRLELDLRNEMQLSGEIEDGNDGQQDQAKMDSHCNAQSQTGILIHS
ncbi:hypothetical protein M8J77_001957 [Diaphorina citri]|jgi:hypothetical protein|nr:hypothetical protein M8J77_001957 [Diaphorina citri]